MTLGVAAHLSGAAVGQPAAEVEDGDPVAQAHDDPHVVLDEQHRLAQLVPDAPDEPHEAVALGFVHARRRLVQQHQLGLGGQGPGDLQPPLPAVGQVRGPHVPDVVQLHELQQFQGPGPGFGLLLRGTPGAENGRQGPAAGAAVAGHHHVFQGAGAAKQADVLEGAGDAHGRNAVGRLPVDGLALKRDGARIGRVHPGNQVENRGLARSVGPDEAGDFALVHVQVHPVHGLAGPQRQAHPPQLRASGRPLPGRRRAGRPPAAAPGERVRRCAADDQPFGPENHQGHQHAP